MSEPIDTMLAETTRKSDSYCLCKTIGILCDRVEQVADTIHDCFSDLDSKLNKLDLSLREGLKCPR